MLETSAYSLQEGEALLAVLKEMLAAEDSRWPDKFRQEVNLAIGQVGKLELFTGNKKGRKIPQCIFLLRVTAEN